MKYQIRFTDGEFQGQVFPIGSDVLSLGRSHTNVVHLQSPDVSGRHVNLTLTNNGVMLENFSSRVTTVDGDPISLGDRVGLVAGQVIGLGSLVKFTLEALPDDTPSSPAAPTASDDSATFPPAPKVPMSAGDDSATVPPSPKADAKSDDDATVPPMQKSPVKTDDNATVPPTPPSKSAKKSKQPSKQEPEPPNSVPTPAPSPAAEADGNDDVSNETISMQTRMASAEELEYMKSSHEKKKMRKTGCVFLVLLSVIAIAAAVYFCFFYRQPEKVISWPRNEAGKELATSAQLDESCPYAKSLEIKYPDVEDASVKKENGKLTIISRLGKYQDVPLRLTMEYFQDRNSLTQNRETTLETWMASKTSGTENWNFDLIQPLAFYQNDHGIPFLCVPYSRTENNESYVGYAVQIRITDWVFILQKEIPTRDRWRAEWFIQGHSFLRFAEGLTSKHWEGTDTYQKGDLTGFIAESRALMRRHSTTVWQKAEYLIRSALCQAPQTPDGQKITADATELLKELRDAQIEYYNAQKIAYLLAKTKRNEKEQKKIIAELKAVFASEEDQRYHKIRQDKWD